MHGHADFVSRIVEVAEQQAIAHEGWDADTIAHRFPQLGLRGDKHACYEPSAGVVFSERCVAAQLRLNEARAVGATERQRREVVTDHGSLQAGAAPRPWPTTGPDQSLA